MWKAMRRETFNLGHCKIFSIVYNIDIDRQIQIIRHNYIIIVKKNAINVYWKKEYIKRIVKKNYVNILLISYNDI